LKNKEIRRKCFLLSIIDLRISSFGSLDSLHDH